MESPPNRIHVDSGGQMHGPRVVLIHGSLDRSAGMARLARVLGGTWRVLRFDRRGYGRSRPHDGPFDVSSQVDDLLEVLDGEPAVLVGHSFGGHIALAAASREPGLVRGVSVYETPLSWMDWWPAGTAGGRAAMSGDSDAAENFMRRLIGDEGWESLPERTKQERRSEGTALRAELLSIRTAAPWDADSVVCKVVCGHGSNGAAHHARGMRWLATALGNASECVLEGAGHGAPNSHPVQFARAMVDVHLDIAKS
ncbi:MAG: alpha/beta fold hydrolase [Acidimicrobiales bacterium]